MVVRMLSLAAVSTALLLVLPSAALRAPVLSSRTLAASCRIGRLYSLSLGSDLLERPDDEDGPEYREYLKALLTLQANRAKTGHAAPSSGSADAYMAKLTRIKIERNMRREAGLPVDEVETAYSDLDYSSVNVASGEPVTVTGGGDGSRKARNLNKSELELQRQVEERIKAAIDQVQGGAPSKLTVNKDGAAIMAKIKLSNSDETLINQVVGNKPTTVAPSKPVALNAYNSYESSVDRKALMKAVIQKSDKANVPVAVTQAPITIVETPKVPGRKLELEELDTAARALQLLVRHRGGGPFGVGRLQGAEAAELAQALREVQAMLRRDSLELSVNAEPFVSASSSAPEALVVPKQAVAVAPKVDVVKVDAPRPAPAPPAPVQAPAIVLPSVASSSEQPKVVTIAQGLDEFLFDAKQISTQDLEGLRDGIIHCLGLIQGEILSRPTAASAPRQEAVRSSLPALSQDEPLEKQLKTVMGLLLKHRGGPSFGHGRLQGDELANMEQRLKAVAAALVEEAVAAE